MDVQIEPIATTERGAIALQNISKPFTESADSVWRGLFSGRYRIVDWYECDGRRYIVTEETADGSFRLNIYGQRVLALRASGQSLKCIAAEMGLTISSAARAVDFALHKLGFRSAVELSRILGHGE